MILFQEKWTEEAGWQETGAPQQTTPPDLTLVFASRSLLESPGQYAALRERYPEGHLVTCSTSGEILGKEVLDDSMVTSSLSLQKSRLHANQVDLQDFDSHFQAGEELVKGLPAEGLKLVFVLSDGHKVNVSELVKGLNAVVGESVPVTGGLAGDGALFERTLVGLDQAPQPGKVIAIGFYGEDLQVGHGSFGGWDPFGPERTITHSDGNLLYELDGTSALELYKNYLGERASELPGSALLFPLSVWLEDRQDWVVRTVLAVDEAAQSMTFAGDLPQGSRCRLMKANFDRLIDGSAQAAESSLMGMDSFVPEFAILISCVGRKLILGQLVEDEVEEASNVLGTTSKITGFYSYGELSPLGSASGCELHNQTMTITTLAER